MANQIPDYRIGIPGPNYCYFCFMRIRPGLISSFLLTIFLCYSIPGHIWHLFHTHEETECRPGVEVTFSPVHVHCKILKIEGTVFDLSVKESGITRYQRFENPSATVPAIPLLQVIRSTDPRAPPSDRVT